MIKEDLVAERVAIASYQEIIRWLDDADPTTRRLMEDILVVEEEHADELVTFLSGSADQRLELARPPESRFEVADEVGIRSSTGGPTCAT